MAALVPWFVWPVVFGSELTLVTWLVLAVRRHGGAGAGRRALGVAAALTAWFGVMVVLSAAGLFAGGADRPPTIALGVFPPIVAGGLALALSPAVRARVLAIPQAWLVGGQFVRVLGIVFLVLFGRGVLPGQFALPAGWGDFAIGVTAPVLAWALAAGKPWAPRLAWVWNAVGLLDLVVAVGVGTFSADSSLRLFPSGPSTDAMAVLPLSLIPTFGVPLFVLLHFASLLGLARSRKPDARASLVSAAS